MFFSAGDLESVHRKIVLQVESQAKEIRATISYQRIKIQHVNRISLFEPILYHVSFFALNKIRDELIKASSATPESPLKPCTGVFRSTMGLPCSHLISERLATGQALQQSDIHEHWWIQGRQIEFLEPTYLINSDRSDLQPLLQSLAQAYQFWPLHQQATVYSQLEQLVNTPPVVLENPVTSRPRGRPVGARNKNPRSTQRDLSAFEYIEEHSRKCGTCHQTGHNRRTCPNTGT